MNFVNAVLNMPSQAVPSMIAQGTMNMMGFNISQSCQNAIGGAFTSELSACLGLQGVVPIIQAGDGSIIPPFDDYLTTYCATPVCSNQTLSYLAGNLTEGCAADLSSWGVPSSVVYDVIAAYPVSREVMCLKTTQPESASLDNASIPITEFSANGSTFCLTDILTQFSAYWGGGNLTIPSALINSLLESQVRRLPETLWCQDCVYGGLALIEEAYPGATAAMIDFAGLTFSIDGYLNDTCGADGFVGTPRDEELPSTIVKGATNQTASEGAAHADGQTEKRAVWIKKDFRHL